MKSLLIELAGHQTMANPKLILTLKIGDVVYDFDVDSTMQTWHFSYDPQEIKYHKVEITLHNKKYLIDNTNYDVSTLCYVIDSIRFNGRDVTAILQTSARYRHDTNGSSAEILEPYTNVLGCDGSLEFQLVTPMFCWWLLDYEF